ncbi:hypothetical protein HN51_015061 [Arachis hypogaea]
MGSMMKSSMPTNRKTARNISSGGELNTFQLHWYVESIQNQLLSRKFGHFRKFLEFVSELARVAAPGATIIIVTWCHRDLGPDEESLKPWEEKHLKKICDAFYLPAWCSTADYVRLLESLSLQVNYLTAIISQVQLLKMDPGYLIVEINRDSGDDILYYLKNFIFVVSW